FWKAGGFVLKDRERAGRARAVSRGAPAAAAPLPATAAPASRAPEGKRILEVRGLSKAFGGLKAVQNVTFSVKEGQILGIIGPNGAGKTTLFNLLCGFVRPDSGEVLLDGVNMAGKPPHVMCAAGLGRTFQVMRPFARMSVADNVVVGAYVHAATDAEARARAGQAIERVGLAAIQDKIAGNLTTKELRLMELARAL